MSAKLLALKIASLWLDTLAGRAVAANVRMSRALHSARLHHVPSGKRLRIVGASGPRLIVREGVTYVAEADGRISEARGVRAEWLRCAKGGRA